MTRLRISPEAEEELARAAEWYEARRTGLGVELVAEVDRAFEAIIAMPLMCPPWRAAQPYRSRPLSRFPYVVFYVCGHDEVFVISVAHTKRRPGYWIDREGR